MTRALRIVLLVCVTAGPSFAQAQLIGVSSVGSALDSNGAGQAEAFLTTAGATGSVTTISVYLDSRNTAKAVYVGLYSNSNGHPRTLLGGGVIASPSAGGWNVAALSPAVQVTANTAYHIAVLGVGGLIQFRDAPNGTHSETSRQTNLTTLPATWSSGSNWASSPMSAYGGGTATGGVQLSISPSSTTVNEGGTKQFSATVTGTSNTGVNWSVISGTGTVTASGLFTAPNRQETDTLQAQAQADRSVTASALITVPAVSIQVAPTSASVAPNATQQFTATVSGTVNTGVRWSESGNGTVTQNGLFTAPRTNETDTVTATAVAAPSPSANATVTVKQAAVGISISPSAATVKEGGTQQFNATVSGTSNTGVNWAVTAGTGTVTASGLFTAPNRQESDTVRAQAQADLTKTASASVVVPAVGIQIAPTSATVAPNGTQQFTATVSGTVNNVVTWSEIGKGTVNQSGLFTAPSTNESDIVRATAAALPSPSADATVTVQPISNSACGNTLNWTNSQCQQIAAGSLNTAMVNGVNDPNAWTVVSRHGEYSQSETECNVPGAVSVANGVLTIKVSAASATCGDFDPSTGARCSGLGSPCPGTFPYTTGDVQWNTFSYKYGVLVVRAQIPTYPTMTWPAIWMLGTNCQNSNKYTGDTGRNGCPNITQTGYQEVDNAEFLGGISHWGLFNIANPGWTYTSTYATAPVDGNYHVFTTQWAPSGMVQYMDGVVESSTAQTINGNLFLILQIQTGGVAGTPVNNLLPAYFKVDYVKVCNSNYNRAQCESAPPSDPNVIFWDDFGGPAQ